MEKGFYGPQKILMGRKMFNSTPRLPQRKPWCDPEWFSTSTQWSPTNICLLLRSLPHALPEEKALSTDTILVSFYVSSIVLMQSRWGSKQRYSQAVHLFWAANLFLSSFSLQISYWIVFIFFNTFSLSIHHLPPGTMMYSVVRALQQSMGSETPICCQTEYVLKKK